ncbi:HAMP domain-containing histidine kinase [bacterium]|nr:HAMP domain-containing histidine kinase [bacterium]
MADLDDALLAARMRSLATFAPDYFHDLSGPLNTIALRLEMLRALAAGGTGDERFAASMTAIEEQVRRLDRMLRNWLAQTAPATGGDAACDLGALLRDLAAVVAPRARKRQLAFSLAVPDDPVRVVVATAPLATALLDLLRHAMSDVDDGGALALVLERQDGNACCRLSGAAFDAAALALAARVAGAQRGRCVADAGGQAAILTLPLAP